MNEISVIYHNVQGYNESRESIRSRADTLLENYKLLNADVIGFQEITSAFRIAIEGTSLADYLKENYTEICHDDNDPATKELVNDGGTPNAMYYKKLSGLTLIDSGYIRARGVATKGTTWALFEKDGKRVCITNLHYVAPHEGGNSTAKCRELRLNDANAWLDKLKELSLDCPVISGGDFNSPDTYTTELDALPLITPYASFVTSGYTGLGTVRRSKVDTGLVDYFDHVMIKGTFKSIHYSTVGESTDSVGSDHAIQSVKFSI